MPHTPESWTELEGIFPNCTIAADCYPTARRLGISERSARLRWKQWKAAQDKEMKASKSDLLASKKATAEKRFHQFDGIESAEKQWGENLPIESAEKECHQNEDIESGDAAETIALIAELEAARAANGGLVDLGAGEGSSQPERSRSMVAVAEKPSAAPSQSWALPPVPSRLSPALQTEIASEVDSVYGETLARLHYTISKIAIENASLAPNRSKLLDLGQRLQAIEQELEDLRVRRAELITDGRTRKQREQDAAAAAAKAEAERAERYQQLQALDEEIMSRVSAISEASEKLGALVAEFYPLLTQRIKAGEEFSDRKGRSYHDRVPGLVGGWLGIRLPTVVASVHPDTVPVAVALRKAL